MILLEEIKSMINSGNLEDKIHGLSQLNKVFDEFSILAANTLEQAQDKLFISEQIYYLHTAISKKLNALFDSTNNKELKIYIALILYTGSSEVKFKSLLLEELSNPIWSRAEIALHKLVQRQTEEAIPIIIRLLEEVPFKEVNKVVMLLNALNSFDVKIPTHISNKLSSQPISQQIKDFLQ